VLQNVNGKETITTTDTCVDIVVWNGYKDVR